MTRATWTTTEQREWLEEYLPGWANAQDNGTTKAYRVKVFEGWYKAFPLGTPTDEELAKAGGNASKALRTKRNASDNVRNICSGETHLTPNSAPVPVVLQPLAHIVEPTGHN
jgi:hypothetical protein